MLPLLVLVSFVVGKLSRGPRSAVAVHGAWLHRMRVGMRLHGRVGMRCSATEVVEETTASLYPQWPESAIVGRRNLSVVLQSFAEVATAVPVEAAGGADSQWKAWLDGGFEAHKFIHKSISRRSYAEVLSCLQIVLARCQEAYPDLWAVLKFVPKKNGLNPVLAALAAKGADAVSVADLKPRVLRRRLEDLQRAFEQSWALISCYLSQPQSVREDLLWAARVVTERVKTDQRSSALELLCLGFYGRGAALFSLIAREECWLRESFARQYSGDDQQTMSALGKRGWERSRLSFPYLELARRTWLSARLGGYADANSPSSTIGGLLFRITRAAPGDKARGSVYAAHSVAHVGAGLLTHLLTMRRTYMYSLTCLL
jgi:hypothetical protein